MGQSNQLETVGPFPRLETLPGDVVITGARQLVAPPNLGGVTTIGGDLHLDDNPGLLTLEPLLLLEAVEGDLSITGNACLLTSEAEAFAAGLSVGGTTTIEGLP